MKAFMKNVHHRAQQYVQKLLYKLISGAPKITNFQTVMKIYFVPGNSHLSSISVVLQKEHKHVSSSH